MASQKVGKLREVIVSQRNLKRSKKRWNWSENKQKALNTSQIANRMNRVAKKSSFFSAILPKPILWHLFQHFSMITTEHHHGRPRGKSDACEHCQ
jgi:hypothetical protein